VRDDQAAARSQLLKVLGHPTRHPFYSEARFFSPDELGRLAREAGLHLRGAACTLLQNPQDEVVLVEPARDGARGKAGFVSLLYGGQSDFQAGGVGAEAP